MKTMCKTRRRSFLKVLLALGAIAILGGQDLLSAPSALADAVSGAWSETMNWPLVAVHMIVLPIGKVLVWSRPTDTDTSPPPPHIWNPNTNRITALTGKSGFPVAMDPYCSGHAFLPNGTLLVDGQGDLGDAAQIYNPFTRTWAPISDTGTNRYYPSNIPLGNGEQLVLGGTVDDVNYPPPQVWKKAGGWRHLTKAKKTLHLYPWGFQTNVEGKVFVAGSTPYTWWLDTRGTGKWSLGPDRVIPGVRRSGTAVMYDQDKIIVIGGTPGFEGKTEPVATAETIDLTVSAPQWTLAQPMQYPRVDAHATILPDGTVLVTGGTSKRRGDNVPEAFVYAAELWNPSTGAWVTLASMKTRRVFHSSAVLLPDGRVLVAGGGRHRSGPDFPSAEIFSPPYLFKGPRPVITSAPASIKYGQVFSVGTPNVADIDKVSLVRLSADTHSWNMNQRLNWLQITGRTATSLRLQAPPVGNICPPGHYLLTLLQGGVPSLSKIVKIS